MKRVQKWMKVRVLPLVNLPRYNLPKLKLELLHAGLMRQRLGILTLAIGIVLAIATVTHYGYTIRQIAVLEASMALPAIQSNLPANNKEVEAVQTAMTHLALPWSHLFAALEAVVTEKVSILSIEPDVSKGTVKIVAESRDVFEMLEYLRALQQQPTLRDVMLTGYDVKIDVTDEPVRFTLNATWVTMP